MKIFSGLSNKPLTQKICERLSCSPGKIHLKSFPSGERYCQFEENIRGADVFLVQSTSEPANDNLMELMIMTDAARRASAGRITAVIPYYGYARQDRKDRSRVPISARLVMDLLQCAGVNRILTMDLHSPQIVGFTNLPCDQLSFKPALVNAVKDMGIEVVVAPDIGAVKRADEYASAMNAELVIISKKRKNEESVELKHFIGDVKGKKVLIVDDLTESAGTIVEAAKACREQGARNVYGAVTHGCFSDVGFGRLKDVLTGWDSSIHAKVPVVIDRLFASNTVEFTKYTMIQDKLIEVDVSPLFAYAIKSIHNNESVSQLFN